MIHGEGRVEDVSLGDDQAVEQGVHSEQESEDITVTELVLAESWLPGVLNGGSLGEPGGAAGVDVDHGVLVAGVFLTDELSGLVR